MLSRKHYIWIKTLLCYLLFVTMGSIVAIPGPTLISLQGNLIDNHQISMIYIFRPLGFIIGAFFSSLALDRVKRPEPILILEGVGMSIFIVVIGFANYSWKIYAAFFGLGVCMQSFNSGINVVILNLWGSEAAGVYQGLHFSFGVGAMLGPLIAGPFIEESKGEPKASIPRIAYAYIIVGVNSLITIMIFSAFVIITWKQAPRFEGQSRASNRDNIRHTEISKYKKIFLLTNVALATFFEQTIEATYGQAVFTFASNAEYKMPSSQADILTASFWAPYMLARFIAIFLTRYINLMYFIIYDLILLVLAGLISSLFAYSSKWAIWVTTIMTGWALGTFFPAAITWISQYIEITFIVGSTFFIAGAFAEMIVPHLLLQGVKSRPKALYHFMLSAAIVDIMFYSSLQLLFFRRMQNRFIRVEPEELPRSVRSDSTFLVMTETNLTHPTTKT